MEERAWNRVIMFSMGADHSNRKRPALHEDGRLLAIALTASTFKKYLRAAGAFYGCL